jgi:hypothetical protein
MGKSFIVTPINHRYIFLRQTFYEIIFVNVSFATSKALQRATIRGLSTLILGLILSLAAGGRVHAEGKKQLEAELAGPPLYAQRIVY